MITKNAEKMPKIFIVNNVTLLAANKAIIINI